MNLTDDNAQSNDEIARRTSINLLTGSIVLAGGSYLLLSFLSRTMSDAEYSHFAAFWSIVTGVIIGITSPLETFSLSSTRTMNGRAQIDSSLLSAIKKVLIIGSVGLLVLIPWFTPLVFDGELIYVSALYVTFLGFIAIYSARGILVAAARSNTYAAIMSMETLLRLALAMFFIWVFSPVGYVVAISFAFAATVSGFLSYVSVRKIASLNSMKVKKFQTTNINRKHSRNNEFYSIAVASLSALIILNLGPFVLQSMSEPEMYSAGFFLNALTIARIPIFIGPILQARIIPKASNLLRLNQFDYLMMFIRNSVLKLFSIGSISIVFFMLFGNVAIKLFFGNTFQFEKFDLFLIALSTVLYLIAIIYQSVLVARQKSQSILKAWCVGLAVYFVVLFTNIEPLKKVEVATVVGLLVVNIILVMDIKRTCYLGETTNKSSSS